LYLSPAGAAATKDMKNAAVVSAVAGMESAIKMLPDSITFDSSSEHLYVSVKRESGKIGCDLAYGKLAQMHDSPIDGMMRTRKR
jgi:hypothetical protein